MLRGGPQAPALPGWVLVAAVQGPRDRGEATAVYRRQAAAAAGTGAPAR
jgi:hypothetical protein